MEHVERLAIAALLHDLPELVRQSGIAVSSELRRVLDLARLDDPALQAIALQAELYATPGGAKSPLAAAALQSIFSRVALHADAEPPTAYRALAALPASGQSHEILFPTPEPDSTRRGDYLGAMFDALAQLAAAVDLAQFDHAYPHLLAWLQRFGWCLPAHSADVSFYDHARLTSAIAVCLARFHAADPSPAAVAGAAEAERFCLLVGDLSGIQRYIFDIAAIGPGGVARRLRARSFYLGALAEALGHYLAWRFDLPLGNLIMASGGKFYVLAANDSRIDERVAQLRQDVDAWLYEQFNAEIGINLAHQAFAGARFQASSAAQPGFGALVGELNGRLGREKRRRGHSVLAGAQGWNEDRFVFRERHFEGRGACISCNKFPAITEANLCAKCERDVNIGRQLPRARYLAYYRHRDGDIPLALGWSARLLAPGELADIGDPYLVLKLNDPQIDELAAQPGSFRSLANYVPVGDFGAGLSFEEIAKAAQGRELLGYVKADVDNLGMLFAHGLRRSGGASHDTAAHIAALSRELDLFFSGWVQHLLSTKHRNCYTIFSGGDDLFLAGPWDQAASLAREIRAELGRFAGNNPDITLSAGILFAKSHYPISRAAEDAEHALEYSKEHEWRDANGKTRTRDQLTVLADTFRWNEAPAIFEQIATLQSRANLLTSALLYDLVEYSRLYRLWQDQQQVEGLRYKALFVYNIARNLRRGDAEIYRWADELVQSLHGGKPSLTMRHLGLIATYLLFARRGAVE